MGLEHMKGTNKNSDKKKKIYKTLETKTKGHIYAHVTVV